MKTLTSLTWIACTLMVARAAEYHVAITGDDNKSGAVDAPFRTIQHAADVAQPGDVITVHAGVYRERVNPPRGGTDENKRITYQAAPGEKAVITGAEPLKGWTKVGNDTWQVVVPNSFFGKFNPFSDRIHGDWCHNPGGYHTGAVYLNGEWLTETVKRDEVLKPAGDKAMWFASVDETNTTILAQFRGVNPNEAEVEINVRQTVFTPSKTGIDFLTVRGFELRAAAAPWAPPTALQTGIITAHWCKRWIIENNRICYTPCCGVSLGKYGDEWDNGESIKDQPEWMKKEMKGGTGGYVATTERALKNGWNKGKIGSHLVRNNEISHCEQTGIVGSLGCAFSIVEGNVIHDIHVRNLYGGAEMGGIKFHGAIDVVIRNNHIYRCGSRAGIWLDWMAQGSHVVSNLLHDNAEDLFLEMQHGPQMVANNLMLSATGIALDCKGIAFAHNFIAGPFRVRMGDKRVTPFQPAHDTVIAELYSSVSGDSGDYRIYNNYFAGSADLSKLDPGVLPSFAGGNVYAKGAKAPKLDSGSLVLPEFDAGVKLEQRADGWYLTLKGDPAWREKAGCKPVTTESLGKAKVTGCAYENPDGSPLIISTDYSGTKRDAKNPAPGPIENIPTGGVIKVWPQGPQPTH